MQSHKQAITRGVQTDPKVPKGKEYAQTGGKGAPGAHPCTHSRAWLLLQRPVSFSQQKAEAGCRQGVGKDRESFGNKKVRQLLTWL